MSGANHQIGVWGAFYRTVLPSRLMFVGFVIRARLLIDNDQSWVRSIYAHIYTIYKSA